MLTQSSCLGRMARQRSVSLPSPLGQPSDVWVVTFLVAAGQEENLGEEVGCIAQAARPSKHCPWGR